MRSAYYGNFPFSRFNFSDVEFLVELGESPTGCRTGFEQVPFVFPGKLVSQTLLTLGRRSVTGSFSLDPSFMKDFASPGLIT